MILDGHTTAKAIYRDIASRVQRLHERGVRPCLVAILVGNNPASSMYVASKRKACASVGILSRTLEFPSSISEEELLHTLKRLNEDPQTHAILVQLPLPPSLNPHHVLESILPDKDVDGFHPVNKGLLLENRARLMPCTPAGIIQILDTFKIPVEGKHAVVLGRSDIVGKPMALLLLHRNATVTVCHSRTVGLRDILQSADILVAAVGRAGFVQPEWIKPNTVIIDVGINPVQDEAVLKALLPQDSPRWQVFREKGRILMGDVSPKAYERASAYTPVPGGVGPMTVAMVVSNTVTAAEIQAELT